MSEFRAEAPQSTAIEGLAQGPYVADRTGFKPMTLRTKGAESTNELLGMIPSILCYVSPSATTCREWTF